eukprot:scaffold105420_cov21-Phaeocystis_antarctica.AAC.1
MTSAVVLKGGMRRKPTTQRFEVAEQNAAHPTRRLSATAGVKNVCGGGGARRGSGRCGMPIPSGHGAAFMQAAAATPDAVAASLQTRLAAQLRATIRREGRIGAWER